MVFVLFSMSTLDKFPCHVDLGLLAVVCGAFLIGRVPTLPTYLGVSFSTVENCVLPP